MCFSFNFVGIISFSVGSSPTLVGVLYHLFRWYVSGQRGCFCDTKKAKGIDSQHVVLDNEQCQKEQNVSEELKAA